MTVVDLQKHLLPMRTPRGTSPIQPRMGATDNRIDTPVCERSGPTPPARREYAQGCTVSHRPSQQVAWLLICENLRNLRIDFSRPQTSPTPQTSKARRSPDSPSRPRPECRLRPQVSAPTDASPWTTEGHSGYHVPRGGSRNGSDCDFRSAYPEWYSFGSRFNGIGFRVAAGT